jgi:hypothetical protein
VPKSSLAVKKVLVTHTWSPTSVTVFQTGKPSHRFGLKRSTVKYDPEKTNPSALEKATTNAGFVSTVHGGAQKR